MNLYAFIIFLAIFLPIPVSSQNDTIHSSKQLTEVIVTRSLIQQESNHYICIPTNKQRKHSHSGFELVRNMMIAGVDVNMETGSISTPAGIATLYINGREVSFREVQSLRPKDVIRIEYYDMPTGRYAKDQAALNYVVKNYTSGGYTQIDGLQTIGFLRGDYNLSSKLSFDNYNANIWTGYNIENPKTDLFYMEHYRIPNEVTKQTSFFNQEAKKNATYFITSLSYITNKLTWMLRAGIEFKNNKDNAPTGSTQYVTNNTIPVFVMGHPNQVSAQSLTKSHSSCCSSSIFKMTVFS